MTLNSRIIAHEFDFFAPQSLAETLELLERHADRAKVLAGGTDLVGQLKNGKSTPEMVVSLRQVPELKGIRQEEGRWIVGGGNTFRAVMEYFKTVRPHEALFEAIHSIGKTQVLNMGTVGGNLANGSPKADTAPPLLTFDARVRLVSRNGERLINLTDFYLGPNRTVMKPEELLWTIEFDHLGPGCSSAFEKKTRVGADISKISCGVSLQREGEICSWCRVAMGASGPTPMRMPRAEEKMKGQTVTEDLVAQVARQVANDIKPPERGRISADYRRRLAAVIFRDAFARAWKKSLGAES